MSAVRLTDFKNDVYKMIKPRDIRKYIPTVSMSAVRLTDFKNDVFIMIKPRDIRKYTGVAVFRYPSVPYAAGVIHLNPRLVLRPAPHTASDSYLWAYSHPDISE